MFGSDIIIGFHPEEFILIIIGYHILYTDMLKILWRNFEFIQTYLKFSCFFDFMSASTQAPCLSGSRVMITKAGRSESPLDDEYGPSLESLVDFCFLSPPTSPNIPQLMVYGLFVYIIYMLYMAISRSLTPNSWVEDDPLAEPHQGGGSGPWQVNESFPEPDWNPRDGDFSPEGLCFAG